MLQHSHFFQSFTIRSRMFVACSSLLIFIACGNAQHSKEIAESAIAPTIAIIDTSGTTLSARFLPPNGYVRIPVDTISFGYYLRNLPLKPQHMPVRLFDGSIKANPNVYVAVVDQPIGKKDLHQCADAVMHLRADHLWQTGQYDRIHFDLTNGFRMDYSEWMKGKRLSVSGNKTTWVQTGAPGNTQDDLWNYLEKVFTFAGTLSLSRELISIPVDSMQIGDVFINGGSPGHAVIVVDMAVDTLTQKKIFMLAQSYMPAQETQILANQEAPDISPWYSLDFGATLHTPEYWFSNNKLMRFPE